MLSLQSSEGCAPNASWKYSNQLKGMWVTTENTSPYRQNCILSILAKVLCSMNAKEEMCQWKTVNNQDFNNISYRDACAGNY